MEKWNIYDKQGTLVNGFLIRGQKIPAGHLHLVVEVIVKHEDGTYLVMQRSNDKESFPNFFGLSAGGAVLYGETSREGALRELEEETGIQSIESISLLDRVINEDLNYIFDNYLVITNSNKKSIEYQKGETQSHRWIDASEVIAMINDRILVPSQGHRVMALMNQNRI